MEQRAYSVLGNIAIVNFPKSFPKKKKKHFAESILEKNKSVKTVLEKSGNFSGELRIQKTSYLAGEKTKEVLYKENNCIFRFNVDQTYFSSRLANERQETCSFVKKGDDVLVMFAGVAPFPIVLGKNTQVKKIYSNELNKKANKYAESNIKRNKLQNKIELLPGDIKKVVKGLAGEGKKFDFILMPRPNLEYSFLKEALLVAKSGTRIYYHLFCSIDKFEEKIIELKREAKEFGFNIKILNTKKIGEIAPGKARFRVYFRVNRLNKLFNLFKRI